MNREHSAHQCWIINSVSYAREFKLLTVSSQDEKRGLLNYTVYAVDKMQTYVICNEHSFVNV